MFNYFIKYYIIKYNIETNQLYKMSDRSSSWQDAVNDCGTSLGTYVHDSSRTR